MTRSDASEPMAPQRLFHVQQTGDRWLVVRRLAGFLDGSAAVVADCLTRSSAEQVADDLNARDAA